MTQFNYAYAVLLGLLYYPLQQGIYFARFGNFNTTFSSMDLYLPLTGILAFVALFYVLNRTLSPQARTLHWVLFVLLAIPLSLIATIGGGLLGPVGAIAYGILPVVLVLLASKGIARLVWGKKN